MSRLKLEKMPETYEGGARKLIDDAFRSLRTVLERGFRWREQVAGVVETVIDTSELPVSVEVPNISRPIAVLLLGAIVQRSENGHVISGGEVTWEWRGGALLIHDVSGLAVTTRYNCVLAVME